MVPNRPKASSGLKNKQPVSLSHNSPEWVFRLKAQHGSTWSFRNQASFHTRLSKIPWTLSFPSARGRKGMQEHAGKL